MPRLAVWMLRSALVNLGIGFTLGALLLWHKGLPISPYLWRLLPAHREFLLMGWTLLLALGVAYWILPRFQTARGHTAPVAASLSLLNLGVWLVAAAPWLGGQGALLATLGRGAEVVAVILFAAHAWPRVKPPGV